MKRPAILWVLLSIFLIILSLWLWQSYNYPHALYEYHQTGEYIEGPPDDRDIHLEYEAVPIWEPDNPLWVDLIRRWAPLVLFFMPWFIIAIEVNFRDKRKQARREKEYQEFLAQR
jgi:hypothetical protein